MAGTEQSGRDWRRLAARADLADARLRGHVEAEQYAEGRPAQLVVPVAALRRAPAPDAARDTEVLFGETLRIFEEKAGWAWVQLDGDDYVGYLRTEELSGSVCDATHLVRTRSAIAYTEPNAVTAPVVLLPMNAAVSVVRFYDGFAELATGGFVGRGQIRELSRAEPNFSGIAESFLGVPYLFGGKSHLGIDCSGLVQVALAAAGISAPRDSDMQERELGRPVALNERDPFSGLERGDLVYWPGHTGIMVSASEIVNANATHMSVTREPLAAVAGRSRKDGPLISSVRRVTAQ